MLVQQELAGETRAQPQRWPSGSSQGEPVLLVSAWHLHERVQLDHPAADSLFEGNTFLPTSPEAHLRQPAILKWSSPFAACPFPHGCLDYVFDVLACCGCHCSVQGVVVRLLMQEVLRGQLTKAQQLYWLLAQLHLLMHNE